jgi:SWI/SNF-related matrix-associated actin-dependent regulator of chromatin subfamily A3
MFSKYQNIVFLQRLRTLIQAICLRRTKSDQVNGRPLVSLPSKTVKLTQLEFTKDERSVYDAYLDKGRELILK